MQNLYRNSDQISKNEFCIILKGGDTQNLCQAIISSVNSIQDYHWLIQRYKKLLHHDNPEVRGVTITCIGHLARINEESDKSELLNILKEIPSDDEVFPRVEDAIDDIDLYL